MMVFPDARIAPVDNLLKAITVLFFKKTYHEADYYSDGDCRRVCQPAGRYCRLSVQNTRAMSLRRQ
jgi:hypothetical protein